MPIVFSSPIVKKRNVFIKVRATGHEKYLRSGTFKTVYSTINPKKLPDEILLTPAISAFLPAAVAIGTTIKTPVIDSDLVATAKKLAVAWQEMYPSFRSSKFSIDGKIIDNSKRGSIEGDLLLYSGGIDALTSLLRNYPTVRELATVWGADIQIKRDDLWEKLISTIRQTDVVNEFTGHIIKTNMRRFFHERQLVDDFIKNSNRNWWVKVQHGIALLGQAMPIAYAKNCKRILIAGTHSEGFLEPWGSSPTTDNLFRCAGVLTSHDSYDLMRQQKISEYIAPYIDHGANVELAVCYKRTRDGKSLNCGYCEKCIRTASGLLAAGVYPHLAGLDVRSDTLLNWKDVLSSQDWKFSESKMFLWKDIQEGARKLNNKFYQGSVLKDYIAWLKTYDFENNKAKPIEETLENINNQAKKEKIQKRVLITGDRVQGVGFRQWIVNNARLLNLTGWVRNRDDGSVEAIVAGRSRQKIDKLIKMMKAGPKNADVRWVIASEYSKKVSLGFSIKKTRRIKPLSVDKMLAKKNARLNRVVPRLVAQNRLDPLHDSKKGQEYWEKGFLAEKISLYDTSRHKLEYYVSDLQREMTFIINDRAREILNNKIVFEGAIGKVAKVVNTAVLIQKDEVTYPANEETLATGEYFAKPLSSGGGRGVFPCSYDGTMVEFENQKMPLEKFYNYLANIRSYLLTEKVNQHGLLRSFYPGSTNTLRILMYRDIKSGKPTIAAAALRLGSSSTGGVDNFSKGGVSFDVNLKTGELKKGISRSSGFVNPLEKHPDSGKKITGKKLPFWQETLEILIKCFEAHNNINYVGWDVIITDSGPVIIEGNSYSNVRVNQLHSPLLKNKMIKRFYEHYGILEYTGFNDSKKEST